jgi:drug/metabolite transporter (DMT)-like permease
MEDTHPMVTLTQNFLFAGIFQMLVFPFIVGPSVFFSFDPVTGGFGWLVSWEAFVLLIFFVAPITGILGNFGFYAAYYYFPMEIVAGVMLVEPFFAQIFGVMMGQDEIPGSKTVIGLTVITVGFILAGFGAGYRENQEAIERRMSVANTGDDEEAVYHRIE